LLGKNPRKYDCLSNNAISGYPTWFYLLCLSLLLWFLQLCIQEYFETIIFSDLHCPHHLVSGKLTFQCLTFHCVSFIHIKDKIVARALLLDSWRCLVFPVFSFPLYWSQNRKEKIPRPYKICHRVPPSETFPVNTDDLF